MERNGLVSTVQCGHHEVAERRVGTDAGDRRWWHHHQMERSGLVSAVQRHLGWALGRGESTPPMSGQGGERHHREMEWHGLVPAVQRHLEWAPGRGEPAP